MNLKLSFCRILLVCCVCLSLPTQAADADAQVQQAMTYFEAGDQDSAIGLLVGLAEQATSDGDKERVVELNQLLTTLVDFTPEWIDELLAVATELTEEQSEALVAWQDMTEAAMAALAEGDAETALSSQETAIMLAEDLLGPEHWISVLAFRDMGLLLMNLGDLQGADRFLGEAASRAAVVLAPQHPETLATQQLLVELYLGAGAPDEANALLTDIVSGYEDALGPFHAQTIDARLVEVRLLEMVGDYDTAMDYLDGICLMLSEGLGVVHPRSISCIHQQADQYVAMSRFPEAEASYEQALLLLAQSEPMLSSTTLTLLAQKAEVIRELGRYDESRQILTAVINTASQINETEVTFAAKSYLGRLLNIEGDYESAQQVTEAVVDYGVVEWQDRPEEVLNTLLELGAIYRNQSKLADAEATFDEAYQGFLSLFGEGHPSTVVALSNLGQIYEKEGLFDEAEPVLKAALELFEQLFGPENINAANARNNLALLYESQGSFREAEPLYLTSLYFQEQMLGEEHNTTIGVRNNLAFLYMLMEDYEKAAEQFAAVQDQWSRTLGDDHQNTLKAFNNLARAMQGLDEFEQAEYIFLDVLARRQEVLGAEHIDAIRSMIDLGRLYVALERYEEADEILTNALELAESNLGDQHPYTFEALNALASSTEAIGQLQAAFDLRTIGFLRRSKFLDTMLWVTGENARQGYISLHKPELDAYLSLMARVGQPELGKRLIDASLQRKGLLLKITSEIQQIAQLSEDPSLQAVAGELEAARKELASRTLSGPTLETAETHTQVLYELERRVNELQGQLGRVSSRYKSSISNVSSDALDEILEEGQALVDFMMYEEAGESKLLAAVAYNRDGEVRYDLVNYADRKAVEDIVLEYRTWIQDDTADEDEILEIGQLAHELIWDPINQVIEDASYVYLVPDGVLNILPFNALVNDDEDYLIQTVDIHLLTSGRDLLPNEYVLAEGRYLVMAGPNYDAEEVVSEAEMAEARGRRSSSIALGIRGGASGLRGLSFEPLPGAEQEGRIIVDRVAEGQKQRNVYFRDDAQEAVLSDLSEPPEILHVATHGFFLEADDTLRKRLLKLQRSADLHVPPPGDNPLLRAGLAFAGINTNAQFLGDIDTANDGVLTALEVLDMNLTGTKLVVLSACETGLGEIHEGEGVYGLRRSFQEAGVSEVISSLWEVSDAGTQALMTDFYDRLLAGTPARIALRDAQLALLDSPQWGYPYIWSAFMIVGSYESSGYIVN